MEAFVSSLIEISFKASFVIVFVLISRAFLSNVPKRFSYLLWSIVGLRLLIPRGFIWDYGIFNLIDTQKPLNNAHNYIAEQMGKTTDYVAQFPARPINYPIRNGPETILQQAETIDLVEIIFTIWLIGFALMLLYGFISYIRIAIKMNRAMILQGNVFESEDISSPFALGLIFPKIYLPLGLNPIQQSCIIAHEKYHIKRFDHLVKLLSFILLSLHWFNPFCWVAFRKMTLDMEMSCDEGVLRCSDNENIKKLYSATLLSMASGRKSFAPSPVSFDGGIAKKRIKHVLKYKSPKKTAVVLCYCICLGALFFCFGEREIDKIYISENIQALSENSLKDGAYEKLYVPEPDYDALNWNFNGGSYYVVGDVYGTNQPNTGINRNSRHSYYFNRQTDYFAPMNPNKYFYN